MKYVSYEISMMYDVSEARRGEASAIGRKGRAKTREGGYVR